ncbi:MAG: hypothetical protein ACT4PP_11585 [Sporichthyaceae bacterium]
MVTGVVRRPGGAGTAVATLIVGLRATVFQGAETEILAGFTEQEAPHLEALEACSVLIESLTPARRPKKAK